VSDKGEIFWKEAVLTYLKTELGLLLEKLRKSVKFSVRIASNLREV
jgi:hypothetical protein